MAVFFYHPDIFEYTHKRFLELYNFEMSEAFMKCAEVHLVKDFKKKTGRKPDKKVSFADTIEDIDYKKGEISSLKQNLWVNHNVVVVTIAWKSKSGKVYTADEPELDCQDIEFWFEDLDVAMIVGILDRQIPLPFDTSRLDFKLKVAILNIRCLVVLHFKEEYINAEANAELIPQIGQFIDNYNTVSENSDRANGLINDWWGTLKAKKIEVEFDLGSATPLFFEQFLYFVSNLSSFKVVEIL